MNKPDIRFNGFDGEWTEKKLEDIYGTISNAFVGTATPYYVERGHFYLESNNVKNGYINKNSQVFINDDFYQRQKQKWLCTDDIVMVQSGHVGHSALIPEELNNTAAHALIIFKDMKFSVVPFFLNIQFQADRFQGTIRNITKGNTIKHILSSDIKRSTVYLPPHFSEQSKIGDLFSQIDSLISSTQKEHDKLVALKKCMLQKMFPKKGSLVPEIRFEGFSGDWVEKKLGEIFRSISNAFVGTASPYYVENGHFYLESNNVKNGQINRNSEIFINDEFYYNQRHKWLHENDIVMVQSGHVGHSAVIPKELDNTAAHALIIFTDKYKTTDSYFINYSFMTSISVRQIEGITKGNTIKHILSSDMKNFIISIPNDYEEQQKIGSYFQNLDNLISKQSAELEKLKNVKKTLLSKMFV